MWAAVRSAAIWLFGDDALKYALYFVVGLFAFAWVQAMGVTHAIMAQPFGQHWLAAMNGAGQVSQSPAQVQPQPGNPIVPVPVPFASSTGDRVAIVLGAAMTWLGTPYLWGGCSRAGVDCSCYLQNILRTVGISAPRTTTTQIGWTRPISRAEIQAGDFLYFNNTCSGCGPNPTHVGMALGNGRMIHAGDPVHIESIDTPYWQSHFNSAGRVPGL